MQKIGLFGGTFDPIHVGHLRMALELKQNLELDEMRLIPCHQPPHRRNPERDSQQRLSMVQLATSGCPELIVDSRELERTGPSFTIDTLAQLRHELGSEVSLSWCVGMDSLANLSSWHRWSELTDLAHLVVVTRPGWQQPAEGEVYEWLAKRVQSADYLGEYPSGAVIFQEQTLLPVSSSQIRAEVAAGRSAQFLLSDAVWDYIKENTLYIREESEH